MSARGISCSGGSHHLGGEAVPVPLVACPLAVFRQAGHEPRVDGVEQGLERGSVP